MSTGNNEELLKAMGISNDEFDKMKPKIIDDLERKEAELKILNDQLQSSKREIEKQMYENEKLEIDENGRRLTRKPNNGIKIGSYNSKHKKFK